MEADLPPPPAQSRSRAWVQRTMDVVLAGAGLLCLAPVFLLMAAWIKWDSPGPVFFRQERVGRGGRVFRIHKFRTMVHQPEGSTGPQLTVGADLRITQAGQCLRRTKLDELAQLIDVLQGTMSLVGPRPEVPRYVALYPDEIRAQVLAVRPGITDLASIEFRDESTLLACAADPEHTYVHDILPRKLRLAQCYVAQASLATDVRILWRTVRILFLAS